MFQSTHPHGVRPEESRTYSQKQRFQSTHPHGVRPAAIAIGVLLYSFNPRTRTGCDILCSDPNSFTMQVSIHAPARGATSGLVTWFSSLDVSIHAPARGATSVSSSSGASGAGFNPRTRTGCDTVIRTFFSWLEFQSTHPHGVRRGILDHQALFVSVSIHAPARGATRCSCAIVCILCFNPRTRTGCDYLGLYISRSLFVSIHAPARGATRSNQPGIRVQRFNPRTRTGCDPCCQFF